MAQETIGQTSLSKVSSPLKGVLYIPSFEGSVSVILTIAWLEDYNFNQALFYAAFYSVSAFNNGGFSLFPQQSNELSSISLHSFTISMLYISLVDRFCGVNGH